MKLRKTLESVFIRDFVIPKAQVLESPGFIVFRMTGKSNIYSRQVVFSENFFVSLEDKLISKFGENAKLSIYSVGKRFGLTFANMGKFFKSSDFKDEKKLVNYIGLINNFIEGTYASKMDFVADISIPQFEFYLKNFVVCNKSKNGYFLPVGAAAGLLCYLLERKDIEGIRKKDLDNGDSLVLYSSRENFLKTNVSFIESDDLEGIEITPEYLSFNAIRPTIHSKTSFQNLLNSKYVSYSNGIIMCRNMRYFIFESSGIYLLEEELTKNTDFKKVLSDVSFSCGEEFFLIGANNIKALSDLLTAFGWGDVFIFEKNNRLIVNIDFFPWNALAKNSNFIIINSILEGALSKIKSRKVKFYKINKTFNQGHLALFLSE